MENWAISRNIPNKDEYIKGHKWKLRSGGKYIKSTSSVLFKQLKNDLIVTVKGAREDFFVWINTIGKINVRIEEKLIVGELRYKENIYGFDISYLDSSKINYIVHFYNVTDITFSGLLKRVMCKTTYCIQCEACEVECPTGALSVYPSVKVDTQQCIHCYKCLNFHNKGCIVADSLSMTQNDNEKLNGISAYGTFGLRDEWLNEFFINSEEFWNSNSLGKKQVPSFKSWLKDSEIIDIKGKITVLGDVLAQMYQNMPDIVWEIIWINLTYNSPLIKWFVSNVKTGTVYSKKSLQGIYEEQYSEGLTTFRYSLDALYNTLVSSPIGDSFHQKEQLSKSDDIRKSHNGISDAAVAYSLYKYGKTHYIKSFRMEDLYNSNDGTGIFFEFGLGKYELEKVLRTLDSYTPRILTAELNMGLDNITLHDEWNEINILKLLTL